MTGPRDLGHDYVVIAAAASWSAAHEEALSAAVQRTGAVAVRLDDGRVAAQLPPEPIAGRNRWRWLAAALRSPDVVTDDDTWRRAASGWAPRTGSTLRILSADAWLALTGLAPFPIGDSAG